MKTKSYNAINKFKRMLVPECVEFDLEVDQSYDSWTVREDTVILLNHEYDNEFHRVTYVQKVYYAKDEIVVWKIRVEGLPEDPLFVEATKFSELVYCEFKQV